MKQELNSQTVKEQMKRAVIRCQKLFYIYMLLCITILSYFILSGKMQSSLTLFCIPFVLVMSLSLIFTSIIQNRDILVYKYFTLHLREYIKEKDYCAHFTQNEIQLMCTSIQTYTDIKQNILQLLKEEFQELNSYVFSKPNIPLSIKIVLYNPKMRAYDTIFESHNIQLKGVPNENKH